MGNLLVCRNASHSLMTFIIHQPLIKSCFYKLDKVEKSHETLYCIVLPIFVYYKLFCVRDSTKSTKNCEKRAYHSILTKNSCFCISASKTRPYQKNSLAKSVCFCVLQSLLGEISNSLNACAFQVILRAH